MWRAGILIITILLLPLVAKAETTQMKLPIFPLECSIDELQTGNGLLTQITPENCIPPKPQSPPAGEVPEKSPSLKRLESELSQSPLVEKLDTKTDAPFDSGYQSVPISDNLALRSSRSVEIEFFTALIALAFAGLGLFAVAQLIIRSGVAPVLLDRFKVKKGKFKTSNRKD